MEPCHFPFPPSSLQFHPFPLFPFPVLGFPPQIQLEDLGKAVSGCRQRLADKWFLVHSWVKIALAFPGELKITLAFPGELKITLSVAALL